MYVFYNMDELGYISQAQKNKRFNLDDVLNQTNSKRAIKKKKKSTTAAGIV